MTFEFDPDKSISNMFKHVIDFVEAQVLWAGLTVQLAVRSDTASRTAVIGLIGIKHWTAIITMQDQTARIISVRRSRDEEVNIYEQEKSRSNQHVKTIKADDFDKLFDEGGDISPYLDLRSARVVEPQIQRVNVDLPEWVTSARQCGYSSWHCSPGIGEKLAR